MWNMKNLKTSIALIRHPDSTVSFVGYRMLFKFVQLHLFDQTFGSKGAKDLFDTFFRRNFRR